MAQKETNIVEQLTQQRQNLVGRFQSNLNIAIKPYSDLAENFTAYMNVSDALIRELQQEIQKLKGQVVKAANTDVDVHKGEVKKKQ